MTVKRATKWMAGVVVAGLVLLLLSIFVADRQLEPPFEQAELGPVEIPIGAVAPPDALFYAANDSGSFELFVQLDDGDVLQLTDDAATDSWRPRLSPDRKTLLFYRSPAGVLDSDLTQASLWMVAADGGEAVEVLPRLAHGWTRQGGAEWSPRGTELVMMGERPSGMQLWVTTVDGRHVRNLVNTPGDSTDPSWSPDARRVAFAACAEVNCAPSEREIFVIFSEGGEPIQITDDDVTDEQPRFSPDGRMIAMRSAVVAANEAGQGAVWDIRTVPTNRSSQPQRLVGDASASGAPIWSDDQTVVFHRYVPGRSDAGLYSARITDLSIVEVLNTEADELFPAN